MSTKNQPIESRKCWIFQAKPEEYDFDKLLEPGERKQWVMKRYFNEIKEQDIVLFWQSGRKRGVYGWGTVFLMRKHNPNVSLKKGIPAGDLIITEYDAKYSTPIPASVLKKQEQLKEMEIFRRLPGTAFKVSAEEEEILKKIFLDEGYPVWTSHIRAETKINVDGNESFIEESIGNVPTITDQVEGVIGVKEIAEVLANIIRKLKHDEKARMVGIFGRWGRGKTFLYNKLKEALEDDNTFIHITFHAWKYQDTPAYWAYLYEVIANKYFNKPSCSFCIKKWKSYWLRLIKLNITRYGWLPLLNIGIFMLSQIVIGIFSFELVDKGILSGFQGVLGGISVGLASLLAFYSFIKKQYSTHAKDVLGKYLKKYSLRQHLGLQAEIQKEILNLIRTWFKLKEHSHQKILLFVDDIDRCADDKILSLIDALRVIVEDQEISQRLTILAAADERVVKRAINKKYFDLVNKDISAEYDKAKILSNLTKEYMDKLFLAGIKLGELTSTERLEIYGAFVRGKIKTNENMPTDVGEALADGVETTDETSELKTEDVSDDATQEIAQTDLPSELEDFELTEIENKFLKEILHNYINANPRSIRIYYYRYLLAKHLLSKEGIGQNENSPWEEYSNKEILPNILLKYSTIDNIDNLVQERRNIVNTPTESISYEAMGKTYQIDRSLLVKILCIVEMVIPY